MSEGQERKREAIEEHLKRAEQDAEKGIRESIDALEDQQYVTILNLVLQGSRNIHNNPKFMPAIQGLTAKVFRYLLKTYPWLTPERLLNLTDAQMAFLAVRDE